MIEIMQWARKQPGFTIVELLIVVVVIAILAAVTIVGYNGVSNRAKQAALQSTLSQAVKKLETAKAASSTQQYPSPDNANLTASSGGTLDYSYNISGNTYCVAVSQGAFRYMATSANTTIREGDCLVESGAVVLLAMNGSAVNRGSWGGSYTVSGATTASGQNGQTNGAYQFSGTSNLAYNGSGTSTDMPLISGSAWVYRDSVGSTAGLMNGIASSPTHWEIASGAWRLRIAGIDQTSIVDPGPLQTWSHVAFTYNRPTGAFRFYLNGELVRSITADSGTSEYFNGGGMTVGQSNGSSRQWLGRIDDFRLYDRELSADDIATIYSAGAR